nr:MAG TPA: hypothetical protein [Bacteriophage sp.]
MSIAYETLNVNIFSKTLLTKLTMGATIVTMKGA